MSFRVPAAAFALFVAACTVAGCARHSTAANGAASPGAAPSADLRHGRSVYEAQCAACHGEGGVAGPIGPSLHNERLRRKYRDVYALVVDPAPPMPKLYPSRLSLSDVRDVSAYVESL
jgi:mono/diheme cytochrome c family protein